jgi:hypothetical protein
MAIRSLKTGSLSRSAQVGNTMIFPGSYESIATVTPYTTTTTVVFSSIPSTFQHLQIRYLTRTTRANQEDNIQLRFNSDTGNNYAAHVIYGDGATASAFTDGSSIAYNTRSVVAAASSTSGVFGAGVIDIIDYANTNKNKTVRSFNGYDNAGAGQVRISSGLWMNTTAISTITIVPANGPNFAANSHWALYGIRG